MGTLVNDSGCHPWAHTEHQGDIEMSKVLTGSFAETLLKIVLVLAAVFILVEVIEGLVGYSGIAAIQAAVVDSLLAGTVPGLLLAGGIGVLFGAVGVFGVLWILDRI